MQQSTPKIFTLNGAHGCTHPTNQSEVAIQVVDAVMESIRAGLEVGFHNYFYKLAVHESFQSVDKIIRETSSRFLIDYCGLNL